MFYFRKKNGLLKDNHHLDDRLERSGSDREVAETLFIFTETSIRNRDASTTKSTTHNLQNVE